MLLYWDIEKTKLMENFDPMRERERDFSFTDINRRRKEMTEFLKDDPTESGY
jgi:hypothetical protein